MTTVDFYAIGTALASVMGSATLTTAPPLGGTAIRQASVLTPNNIAVWPNLVVEMPSSAEDVAVGNGYFEVPTDWDAYFIIAPASGSEERIRQTLLMWLGALVNSTYSNADLGLSGTVAKSFVVSFEEGIYNFGGTEYPAWHLVVRVWIRVTGITFTP